MPSPADRPPELDPTHAPSVFDVDVLRLAKVYAQALLNVAAKAGQVDAFQEYLDRLFRNPMNPRPHQEDLGPLLVGGLIPRSKRDEVIRKAFEGRAHPLFVDFLRVLDDHDRLELLRPIAAMYRELRDALLQRVRVVVKSAVPLSDAQRETLERMARDHYKLEPVLVETVDPSLVAGITVQIGDRMIDLSVRTRLETIRQQLITRSSHEIQRRRDRVGPAE